MLYKFRVLTFFYHPHVEILKIGKTVFDCIKEVWHLVEEYL